MQTIVMTAVGDPEVLQVRDLPDPHPGTGEILVQATAIPVLYPEIALRTGIFPMAADLPAVFGFQAAGAVIEIGARVDPALLGAHVVAATAGSGAYAEKVCVQAEFATVIPAGLSVDAAAAVLMGGSVAIALLRRAALTGTETVLIQAAAAGVGGYLTQLAGEFGAKRVIATAGGAKAERARALGAHEVIDHRDPNWTQHLRDTLGDNTIDVVFESIGGPAAADLLDLMTPLEGRMLGYGTLSGLPAAITAADLFARGLTYTACAGPAWLGTVAAARAEVLRRAADGTIEPLIDRVLPLDQAAQAHRLVEDRRTVGTIILRPNPTAA
ncbi:quinone oxidoreductase family protein [Nocardia macrotermitis]|uniref:Quinone oxidoreductase 1 n=1 Tax=Nocardia macrotermitis TaxID=2585198 RepID=A0A7K0DAP9_9NOCA|nr:zinc-binding dehydrogenase [Nocardia macrotermitis]MQY21954.1 Quinone oxidoreductase 1 [Nocardia macrotermitis]